MEKEKNGNIDAKTYTKEEKVEKNEWQEG